MYKPWVRELLVPGLGVLLVILPLTIAQEPFTANLAKEFAPKLHALIHDHPSRTFFFSAFFGALIYWLAPFLYRHCEPESSEAKKNKFMTTGLSKIDTVVEEKSRRYSFAIQSMPSNGRPDQILRTAAEPDHQIYLLCVQLFDLLKECYPSPTLKFRLYEKISPIDLDLKIRLPLHVPAQTDYSFLSNPRFSPNYCMRKGKTVNISNLQKEAEKPESSRFIPVHDGVHGSYYCYPVTNAHSGGTQMVIAIWSSETDLFDDENMNQFLEFVSIIAKRIAFEHTIKGLLNSSDAS